MGVALLAQLRELRPDVVHVQCIDTLDPALVAEMHKSARLVIGQIAAPPPTSRALRAYDLLVSSLPNFVARFRRMGLDAEWLPLAFEPTLVERIGQQPRTVALSFVGSLSRQHRRRVELLEGVAARQPVSVWTADSAGLPLKSPLRGDLHPAAWGAEMYRVLASSQVTINTHIDIAGAYANNLRLYEATGMGALLLTDRKSNLGELFDVGREVVAYADARECAEMATYYVQHPEQASAIAAAGQTRTLRDHTWLDRMMRLVEIIRRRL